MPDQGTYLYCIIEGGDGATFGPLGIGGRGDELYTVTFQDIGAVVSRCQITRYPVSRENSLAHERAIEAAFKFRSVLPVRYSTIAEDEREVRAILAREYGELKGLLGRMRGKTELGVKAIFHEELIFREILERHAEIRRRKDALAAMPPQRAHAHLV